MNEINGLDGVLVGLWLYVLMMLLCENGEFLWERG